MPRHSLRQTGQPRARLAYDLMEEHELEERQHQRDNAPECNLPSIPFALQSVDLISQYSFRCVTWLGLLAVFAFTGIAIGFTAKFLADGSKLGLDVASADFALYKNSRFQECRAREPRTDAATCLDALASLPSTPAYPYTRIMTTEFTYLNSNEYWCEIVNCLNSTVKVVPSTPRNSAFAATPLTVWCSIAITLFTMIWDYESLNLRKTNKTYRACKALGEVAWYYWVLHAYNLCSFVWWWVSFASYVTSPAYTAPPGIIGWVVPWKYATPVKYHPYSCAAANKCRPRTLSWIFNLVALVQWVATVYVLHVGFPNMIHEDPAFQSYDCATAFIAEAPGLSPCSVQQLCAKPGFFADPRFRYYGDGIPADLAAIFSFGIFTVAGIVCCIVPIGPLVSKVVRGRPLSMDKVKEIRKKNKMNEMNLLALAAWAGVLSVGTVVTMDVIHANSHGQEAPLTIYPACNAVHVRMSTWRFNLDVDQYQKVMRLVKMWFNA